MHWVAEGLEKRGERRPPLLDSGPRWAFHGILKRRGFLV
jgi:hypothetical protein